MKVTAFYLYNICISVYERSQNNQLQTWPKPQNGFALLAVGRVD